MNSASKDQINSIPSWQIKGDWFDVCSCLIPCPCTMAQAPTSQPCEGIFAYKINNGHFGQEDMAGLNVVILFTLHGNAWGGGDIDVGIYFDASANQAQREGLQMIFTGQAGGWMATFVPATVRDVKGIEFANITVNIEENLEYWNVEVPGVMTASGEALSGPTSDPSRRVQTFNPPGSEVGPTNGAVTWGKSLHCQSDAMGLSIKIPTGRNSKHIPFEWNG